jgi:hypothetical protein
MNIDINQYLLQNRGVKIPSGDIGFIAEVYGLITSNNSEIPKFIDDVNWRLYTEWCMDTPKNKDIPGWKRHLNYDGEGFTDWVRDETHFAISRSGKYSWNEEKKFFEGLSSEKYKSIRQEVITAVVKCAIEFFKTGGAYREDSLNLRQSLKPYLEKHF